MVFSGRNRSGCGKLSIWAALEWHILRLMPKVETLVLGEFSDREP